MNYTDIIAPLAIGLWCSIFGFIYLRMLIRDKDKFKDFVAQAMRANPLVPDEASSAKIFVLFFVIALLFAFIGGLFSLGNVLLQILSMI